MARLASRSARSSPVGSLCTSSRRLLLVTTGITLMRGCLSLMDFMEPYTSGLTHTRPLIHARMPTNEDVDRSKIAQSCGDKSAMTKRTLKPWSRLLLTLNIWLCLIGASILPMNIGRSLLIRACLSCMLSNQQSLVLHR